MKVSTMTATGKVTKSGFDWKLDAFKKDPNQKLVAQAYQAFLAAARTNNSKTLKRGEVRGGGKKPWQQKGTGRARHGSIRSPIWRGGGITFGPIGNENYVKRMNKSASRSALRSALQLKSEQVVVTKSFPKMDSPKTSEAKKFIDGFGEQARRIVLVSDSPDENFTLSIRNLSNVSLSNPQALNIKQIVDADMLVFEEAAAGKIESRLA